MFRLVQYKSKSIFYIYSAKFTKSKFIKNFMFRSIKGFLIEFKLINQGSWHFLVCFANFNNIVHKLLHFYVKIGLRKIKKKTKKGAKKRKIKTLR